MTAMSSRRTVATPAVEKTTPNTFLVGFVCGLAMLIAGLHFEVTPVAGVGLAIFVASVLYETVRVAITDGHHVPTRD